MVWPLRIPLVNKLMLPGRTCNDMHFFGLDFISHPEECNGEMDLGCWMLVLEEMLEERDDGRLMSR